MAEENSIPFLFLIVLIFLLLWRTLQGGDPNNSLLVWFGNHPDLFVGIIVFLFITGAVLNIASRV